MWLSRLIAAQDSGAPMVIAVQMMSIGILIVPIRINAQHSVDAHLTHAYFQEISVTRPVFLAEMLAVRFKQQVDGKL